MENKKKYQAFGVQLIDPRWLRNHVICVGFVSVPNSQDITVSDTFDADVMKLMNCDVGPLYLKLNGMTEVKKSVDPDGERVEKVRSVFGLLPLMASCSDGQIGALNAESYAERVISGASLVMTNGSTLLDDEVLEMLVVLRMNRSFITFMREHYFSEIKKVQPYNMALIEPSKPGEDS